MKTVGNLQIEAKGELEIVMTREFNAPRKIVFDTFTKPEFVRRWLLGPDGWVMEVCEIDLRVGGKYRYVWRNEGGRVMGMGGIYKEIVIPEKIVNTEGFDESWYEGEAVITTIFAEKNGKTVVTATMLYGSTATRDAVVHSPMESGVAASYDRLEKILESL